MNEYVPEILPLPSQLEEWVLRGFSEVDSHEGKSYEKNLRRELSAVYRATAFDPDQTVTIGLTSHGGIGATVHALSSSKFIIAFNGGIAEALPRIILRAFHQDVKMKDDIFRVSQHLRSSRLFKLFTEKLPSVASDDLFTTIIVQDLFGKIVQFLYFHEASHISLGHFKISSPIKKTQAAKQSQTIEFEADINATVLLSRYLENTIIHKYPSGTPKDYLIEALEGDIVRIGCGLSILFHYFWLDKDHKPSEYYPTPQQRVISVVGGALSVGIYGGLTMVRGARVIPLILEGFRLYHIHLIATVDRNWLIPEIEIEERMQSLQEDWKRLNPSQPDPHLPRWFWKQFPEDLDRLAAEADALAAYYVERKAMGPIVAISLFLIRSILYCLFRLFTHSK